MKTLMVAFLLFAPIRVVADEGFVNEAMEAFEVCRVFVETGGELNVDEFLEATASDYDSYVVPPVVIQEGDREVVMVRGIGPPDMVWRSATGALLISLRVHRDVRVICEVKPATAITATQAYELISAFSDLRSGLLYDGDHVLTHTTPLRGVVSISFGPKSTSSQGFCAINVLSVFEDEGDLTFTLSSADQIARICSVEGGY